MSQAVRFLFAALLVSQVSAEGRSTKNNPSWTFQLLKPEPTEEPIETLKPNQLKESRKEWCRAIPFKQTVSSEGCISEKVVNRLCMGQCTSWYIPSSEVFTACSMCMPTKMEDVDVLLRCPNKPPGRRFKRVAVVRECGCRPCDYSPNQDGAFSLRPN